MMSGFFMSFPVLSFCWRSRTGPDCRGHHGLALHQQARGSQQGGLGHFLRIARIGFQLNAELAGRMLHRYGLAGALGHDGKAITD